MISLWPWIWKWRCGRAEIWGWLGPGRGCRRHEYFGTWTGRWHRRNPLQVYRRVPETRWAEEPQGLNPTAIQQGCLPQVQKITFIHSNTHGHNKKSISSILQFRGRSLNTLCPRFSGCQASCRWSVFQLKGTWEGFGDGGCTYVVHIFGFPRSRSWLDGVGCLSGTSLRLHECCATRLCSNGMWGRETRPRTFLGRHPCRCRGSAWFASWFSWWYQSATNDQRSLGWWCSPKVQQQQTSTCFGALRCHHHLWRCVRSRRSSVKPLWRLARRAHTSTRSSTEASAKTARFFGGKARCPGGFYGGQWSWKIFQMDLLRNGTLRTSNKQSTKVIRLLSWEARTSVLAMVGSYAHLQGRDQIHLVLDPIPDSLKR